MNIRCLPVSQKALLLLQLFDLVFVAWVGAVDQFIDGLKIPSFGNIEASVLFPDAITP